MRTKRLIVKNVPPSPVDVVFIIEDSPAISDGDWDLLKAIVTVAVKNCSLPKVNFSLVINSLKENVLLPMSNEEKEVTQKLQNYPRTKGTFTLSQYLSIAVKLIGMGQGHIIILAATPPDSQAKSIINKMRENELADKTYKTLITAALFNMNSISDYEQICTMDSIFSASDSNNITKILDPQKMIHDYAVAFQVVALDVPVSLGQDLKLKITTYNTGKQPIPPGMNLFFVGSSYFSPQAVFFREAIEDRLVHQVTLLAKGEESPAKLPTYLEFILSHQSLKFEIHCPENAISLYSEMFTMDILSPPCKPFLKQIPFYNILCFGVVGSGKSSFINALFSLLNVELITPAAVGGATGYVTKELKMFSISTLPGYEEVPIRFFDIWGLEGDNYKEDMLLQVVGGDIPLGYQMTQGPKYSEEVKEANWTKFERRIHCVLFFMPSGIFDAPAIVSNIHRNLSLCTSTLGLNPLIIVTRAAALGGPENEEKRRQELARKFSVPASHIFMIENYTNEKEKDMAIDKKSLEILTIAIKSCITFQRFYRDSLLGDYQLSFKKPTTSPTAAQEPTEEPRKCAEEPRKCPQSMEHVEQGWDECPVCEFPLM